MITFFQFLCFTSFQFNIEGGVPGKSRIASFVDDPSMGILKSISDSLSDVSQLRLNWVDLPQESSLCLIKREKKPSSMKDMGQNSYEIWGRNREYCVGAS